MRAELKDLYYLICGKGRYFMLSPGLRTFPGLRDKLSGIHKACEELEAEGKIARQMDEPDYVLWVEACEHGKGINDYCEPCGRVNGG